MYGKLSNGILITMIIPIFDNITKNDLTILKVMLFFILLTLPSACPVAGAFFIIDKLIPFLLPFFRQYQLPFFSFSAEHHDSSSCKYNNHTAENCSSVNVIVGNTSVRRVRNFFIKHICINSLSICYSDLF